MQGGADRFLDYLKGWFMYSYEDRLRAVRLYTNLGKRVALTIRKRSFICVPCAPNAVVLSDVGYWVWPSKSTRHGSAAA